MNKFIRLITFNYIKNFFKKRNSTIPATISILSIAISVFSLIIVLSVMKGFEVKVKQKILKSFPHIIINSDEKLDLKDIVGIDSYRKTSEDYGALLLKGKMSIVQIKGLDYDADSYLINEDVDSIVLKDGRLPIVINKELSIEFKLEKNSEVEILTPDFTNKKPKIKRIKTYVSHVSEFSSNAINKIFMSNIVKSKYGLSKKMFIEVSLSDPYKSKAVMKEVLSKYPELKSKIIDWQTINSSFFSLMKLERLSISIFLMFLILISATNIYSNIVSFIIEKKNEIGTMILLGASKKSLILVFTFVGLFLGLIGTFIGALLSAATIYFITRTNIIDSLSIDVSFYQIEGFPIIFSIEYFIFISLFSIVAVIISSFIPSYLILNKDLESLIRRNY